MSVCACVCVCVQIISKKFTFVSSGSYLVLIGTAILNFLKTGGFYFASFAKLRSDFFYTYDQQVYWTKITKTSSASMPFKIFSTRKFLQTILD